MRPFQIKSHRSAGSFALSRGKYLESSKIPAPRSLCQAQVAAQWNLKTPTKKHPSPHGTPWLTLVLGSGCLEPTGDSGVTLARDLVTDVGQRLNQADDELPGLAQLATRFTQSLLADRFGLTADLEIDTDNDQESDEDADGAPTATTDVEAPGADEPAVRETLVSTVAAELIAITALVTALYHSIEAQSVAALRRYGDAEASYANLESGRIELGLDVPLAGTVPKLAMQTSRRIRALDKRKLLGAERPGTTILEVLKRIRAGLGERDDDGNDAPVVRALDLHLLTDLTWSRLVEETMVYPGWSDLLLELSAQTEIETTFHGPPRPIIENIRDPSDALKKRYDALSKKSWRLRVDTAAADGVIPAASSGLEPRLAFFDAAARVIAAQADLRRTGRHGPHHGGPVGELTQHPIASAFVTTFDLELEMALLARRRAFAVVMPVHSYVGADGRTDLDTSLAWVGCRVEAPGPDEALTDRHLEPLLAPSRWFSTRSLTTEPDLSDLPMVVRFNGCPLIGLPKLQDDAHGALRSDLVDLGLLDADDEVELQHALVIDEYTALLHATADVYVAPNSEDRWGLPPALTEVPVPTGGRQSDDWADQGNDRFWMFLGVQVGDHGIRHRLATQLSAPRLTNADTEASPSPNRTGVVVTRRIGSAERELLHWHGFDIVKEFCGTFEVDLHDYARHLEADRPMSKDRCTTRDLDG